MKFFVDTADLTAIKELAELGWLDGVTTNPTLIAQAVTGAGKDFKGLIKEICAIVEGPVSAEVAATDYKIMLAEGRILAAIAPNVAVKVPLTMDGLKTCRVLRSEGTLVNVTLCFSAAQALLAAKAGASFISPFVGRLDDIAFDGLDLIADIMAVYSQYPDLETEVLVASVRSPLHVVQAAKMGADVATCPPKVLHQMIKHPLTDKGLEQFLKDWKESGQKI